MRTRLAILIAFALAVRALAELTPEEENRLASALAVIEQHLGTNYMRHSNFGILLLDAASKEAVLGDGQRIPQTIPIYERIARTLTNGHTSSITNLAK